MRLIADSGSTKTDWCVVRDNAILLKAQTQGMNPYVHSDDSLDEIIKKELLSHIIDANSIDKVEFYGAGCSDVIQVDRVHKILSQNFKADISVDHDLLGAAKSVCKDQEGIAVILGTGSNSCHFNGTSIVKNVKSLGYLLGDEGSGCYIGKKLIQDYLNGDMPIEVAHKLESEFEVSTTTIFDKVYKQPLPNRYLASFAKWISLNQDHKYLHGLIQQAFIDFFEQHIIKYKDHQELPINVVGSVGFHNQEILKNVGNRYNCTIGSVIKSPIEGLV